ncbi:MAG: hemerythrin domain-containing protein [Sphingomonas sp.]|uniref:hemerythrin domain-containing protein n=1 Tax=Sphingomonas sp. TaxID=28214 RepID=UPI001B25877A|nr:hemerythrin domain-containing protein [Sphingomonas sp.]MBO9624420.1 hemerythrin domain-containing protein [Sphingomonas sp.]
MSSIKAICEEHRALEARAAQLLRIVGSPVADPAAVTALRWGMAQALVDHCAHEEREVYALLFASGDDPAIAVAGRFRADHDALARRFAGYVAAWPIARIAREWEVFRSDTAELVIEIKRRITAEEAELHPHYERLADRRAAA